MIAAYAGALVVGFLSAFLPVLPAEPYVVGGVAAGGNAVAIGLLAAAGQTSGKVLILLAVRGAFRSERARRWTAWILTKARRAAQRPAATSTGAQPPDGTAPGRPRGESSAGESESAAGETAVGETATGVRAAATGETPTGESAAGAAAGAAGREHGRIRRWIARTVALLDRPQLAVPIVFCSATAGMPPLLAVSVYAARTPIRASVFGLVVFAGRALRFVALALVPGLFM
jgi:membrane protein YqaA with SNARE-associated domain